MTNRAEKGKGREALRRTLPLSRFYDVGGRQLMVYASGTGGPVVVFLPGAGLTGLGYLNLHEQVSQFTTSVFYDRSGTGWSDHAEPPRSETEVTDEPRLLLCRRPAGAYVLVGHSLGGIYARRFARRLPADVAGLLFLDPAHEDYTTRLPTPSLPRTASHEPGPLPRLCCDPSGTIAATSNGYLPTRQRRSATCSSNTTSGRGGSG